MRKLAIPLFIPLKEGQVDYESLKNIIDTIDYAIILIGDYNLNKLNEIDYINVYLYLTIINPLNEYYYEKDCFDSLIKSFKYNKDLHYISKLGNIFPSEVKEYLLNQDLEVNDKSLNSYLDLFNRIIQEDEKNIIEYILIKKKKIITKQYKEIDNLIGINEL